MSKTNRRNRTIDEDERFERRAGKAKRKLRAAGRLIDEIDASFQRCVEDGMELPAQLISVRQEVQR